MHVEIATEVRNPRLAMAGLGPDTAVHGVTDGTWSVIDALRHLLHHCGPSSVVISTWTASNADIAAAERMLKSQRIRTFRLVVDRSFPSRQPRYCEAARARFGDDAIRLWDSHAKFLLVQGDDAEVLYLTSANLNKNKRIENFSAFQSAALCDQYAELINRLYALQKPGEGFANPPIARHHTAEIMGGVVARCGG